MRIEVEKPSAETIDEMTGRPIWSKEVSVFDWEYDAPETCYVTKVTDGGETEVCQDRRPLAAADLNCNRTSARVCNGRSMVSPCVNDHLFNLVGCRGQPLNACLSH